MSASAKARQRAASSQPCCWRAVSAAAVSSSAAARSWPALSCANSPSGACNLSIASRSITSARARGGLLSSSFSSTRTRWSSQPESPSASHGAASSRSSVAAVHCMRRQPIHSRNSSKSVSDAVNRSSRAASTSMRASSPRSTGSVSPLVCACSSSVSSSDSVAFNPSIACGCAVTPARTQSAITCAVCARPRGSARGISGRSSMCSSPHASTSRQPIRLPLSTVDT